MNTTYYVALLFLCVGIIIGGMISHNRDKVLTKVLGDYMKVNSNAVAEHNKELATWIVIQLKSKYK